MEEVHYVEAAIFSAYILAGIAIWMHVVRTKFRARTIIILNFAVLLGTLALVIAETILTGERLAFREFLALDFLFSMLLYVVLCEALLSGGSRLLTKWRGDKWAKELDYPYLILGGFGVVLAIGRSSLDAGRVTFPQTIGPIAVSIALVIRAIKTRAEINRWNET
jgi:hypothetical protein